MPFALTPALPVAFNQYFAGWTRIETRCRSDQATAGLEARTADPLWLVGREWQFGEFRAEDAGSPVAVEMTHQTALLRQVSLRRPDGAVVTTPDFTIPLETLVEREAARWERDWRVRVRVGQQFEQYCRTLLPAAAAAVIADLRVRFALLAPAGTSDLINTDRATRRYRRLMAGKVVDGWRVWSARAAGTTLVPGTDLSAVFKALGEWLKQLYSEPDTGIDSWQPERLDYRFGVVAPFPGTGGLRLSAPSYRNGDFDWHSCRIDSDPITWPIPAATQRYAPTRVTFAGMPLPRYWAFEDARVDFGTLDVTTCDVAKLALAEFALVYGDDWFMAPLDVPLGSCTHIVRLAVTNVFGETRDISPARTAGQAGWTRWQMYVLERADGTGFGDFLFVPPAIGFREESEPLEEVRFVRDEGANMVWGVESLVPNGLGAPVDGFDAQLETRARRREVLKEPPAPPPPPVAPGAMPPLNYRLATPVPANWIPFVPADALLMMGSLFRPGVASVRLLRAQMLMNEVAQAPVAIPALTRLLTVDGTNPNPLRWLDEEAVPRDGVRVQLTRQRVRWTDGRTYVWLGKRVLVGRGEGSSGLRFDVVK